MSYLNEVCEYTSNAETFQNIPEFCNNPRLDQNFTQVCIDGYRGGQNGQEKEINDCINTYGNEGSYVYMCMFGKAHRGYDDNMALINSLRG